MNDDIRNLLNQKKTLSIRLNSIPYSGTPEIKESKGNKYLYVRKREFDRITSTYVGPFSNELYSTLLKNQQEAKSLKKELRQIEKALTGKGYEERERLTEDIRRNLDFARRELKRSIYDQAILEGVATTYADTETILENGIVNNMRTEDVLKILNLKHAWEFILDKDVIMSPSDYSLLCMVNKLVNQEIYYSAGRIRTIPVRITGTDYIPPLVIESMVKEELQAMIEGDGKIIDVAIRLALYIMKKQVFDDGNKRTGIIYANHYLIAHAGGLLVIPFDQVKTFQKYLVSYYESDNDEVIRFLKKDCWQPMVHPEEEKV